MGSTGLHNLHPELHQNLEDYISRLSLEAPPLSVALELPQNLQDVISGLNLEALPLFVAQKLLTVFDVNQNRLRFPESLINAEFLDNFLTKDEKEQLDWTKHVQLNLVDDMMREYNTLHMKKWDINSSSLYQLTWDWNDVVQQNKLKTVEVSKDCEVGIKVGMVDDNKLVTVVVARVWSFRRESTVWFALSIQAVTEVKILRRTKEGRYIVE